MPDAVGWTPSSAQTNFSDGLRIVDAMGSFQSRDTCRVSGEVAHGIQKTMIRPLPSYSHPGEPPDTSPDFVLVLVQVDGSAGAGHQGWP
jgi:hypothetical protein